MIDVVLASMGVIETTVIEVEFFSMVRVTDFDIAVVAEISNRMVLVSKPVLDISSRYLPVAKLLIDQRPKASV